MWCAIKTVTHHVLNVALPNQSTGLEMTANIECCGQFHSWNWSDQNLHTKEIAHTRTTNTIFDVNGENVRRVTLNDLRTMNTKINRVFFFILQIKNNLKIDIRLFEIDFACKWYYNWSRKVWGESTISKNLFYVIDLLKYFWKRQNVQSKFA